MFHIKSSLFKRLFEYPVFIIYVFGSGVVKAEIICERPKWTSNHAWAPSLLAFLFKKQIFFNKKNDVSVQFMMAEVFNRNLTQGHSRYL